MLTSRPGDDPASTIALAATFESGTTDFSALDPQTVDLATMLDMEFALTYGNDWFIVPLPTDIDTLSTVDTLI